MLEFNAVYSIKYLFNLNVEAVGHLCAACSDEINVTS